MATNRHLARTRALQSLSAITVQKTDEVDRIFSYICSAFEPELSETTFAKELFYGVLEKREEIDTKLQQFAPKWPITKLSSVERSALEIAAYELLYHPDTPLAVILNEAVELAKEFGDDTAGSFVNGVLSNFGKDIRNKKSTKKE